MAEVTDPELLSLLEMPQSQINKNVTLSDGQAGVGSNEAKTREAQFASTPQLRGLLRDLGRAQMFNQRLPTGRWKARMSEIGQEFPTDWQSNPQAIADYQAFMGLRQGMAKPVIALTAPAGTTTSSKEMDTPKELELALTSVPGPDKERGANEFLINRTGVAALDKLAFNSFMDRWRANFGSVYGKDKSGRTAQQAWQQYQATPQYRQTVATPLTQLIEQNRPRARSAPRRSTLPSGWGVEVVED